MDSILSWITLFIGIGTCKAEWYIACALFSIAAYIQHFVESYDENKYKENK